MVQIPAWKPLTTAAPWKAPYRASMMDIAPRLTAPAIATPTWAQCRGKAVLGMAKLFGSVREYFTELLGRPRLPQLALAGIAGSGMATIMHMESREFAQGRKAAHAARVNYMKMPLARLAGQIKLRRTDMQTDLIEWAQEIITHLGNDLWADHEGLPNPRYAMSEGFWADVTQRVGNVFQLTSARTDEQSVIADTIVHDETQKKVGVSMTQFEKAVAKRLPDGEAFVALARMHDEMSDLYHDTLLPEIDERKLTTLEAQEASEPGDPQPLDFS